MEKLPSDAYLYFLLTKRKESTIVINFLVLFKLWFIFYSYKLLLLGYDEFNLSKIFYIGILILII